MLKRLGQGLAFIVFLLAMMAGVYVFTAAVACTRMGVIDWQCGVYALLQEFR